MQIGLRERGGFGDCEGRAWGFCFKSDFGEIGFAGERGGGVGLFFFFVIDLVDLVGCVKEG